MIRFIGRVAKLGLTMAAEALGTSIGEPIAYCAKIILFPEFRDAELASAEYYAKKSAALERMDVSPELRAKLLKVMETMEEVEITEEVLIELLKVRKEVAQ